MLTKFEKKALAFLTAVLMCASVVLTPGLAARAEDAVPEDEKAITEAAVNEEDLQAEPQESEEEAEEVEIFSNPAGYYYLKLDDGTIAITFYEGKEKELTIPSNIDGYTVSMIYWGAFGENTTIEKVTIPSTVTAIEYYAFSTCNNLKEVSLPSGLKKIGRGAFYNCNAMDSVIIPKNVTEIGEWALGVSDVVYNSYDEEKNEWDITVKTVPDFIIYGYEGTEAQTYADENGINFAVLAEYGDVNPGDWYYRYVNWAYANGLMTGYDNGNFGPADNLTRGQFATILYRYEGEPETAFDASAFPDVVGDMYYSNPVIWAKDTGVVGGYDNGNFGPNDNMNREQLATMMFRYAKYKGYDITARADLGAFPDAANVNTFAKEAMQWAVAEKLITGDNGNLNPQGTANRAVTATIVNRFVDAFAE